MKQSLPVVKLKVTRYLFKFRENSRQTAQAGTFLPFRFNEAAAHTCGPRSPLIRLKFGHRTVLAGGRSREKLGVRRQGLGVAGDARPPGGAATTAPGPLPLRRRLHPPGPRPARRVPLPGPPWQHPCRRPAHRNHSGNRLPAAAEDRRQLGGGARQTRQAARPGHARRRPRHRLFLSWLLAGCGSAVRRRGPAPRGVEGPAGRRGAATSPSPEPAAGGD